MKNKGTTLATILLIIFIIILGFLSYIFFRNMKHPEYVTKDKFSDELKVMGDSIYKDYYYEITKVDKTDEQLKEFLGKFQTIGLQFNLVELSKYSEENREKIDAFISANDKCSKENTAVIIYPKSPYGKTDFTSETVIDCGVEKKAK